jgi:hypothetical protein
MRGDDRKPDSMFSYVSPEQRVPADHPLRAIRSFVDEAQFDNDVRSERTRGGMKAALELGRWTFLALGYLNAPHATGKSLIPDPERAALVRRAFEDFATGRFTKDEVRKNLNALGLTTRRGKPIPSQTFDAFAKSWTVWIRRSCSSYLSPVSDEKKNWWTRTSPVGTNCNGSFAVFTHCA